MNLKHKKKEYADANKDRIKVYMREYHKEWYKHNKDKMLEKLFKTSEIFDSVLPEGIFLNYKLKRNKKALEELLK